MEQAISEALEALDVVSGIQPETSCICLSFFFPFLLEMAGDNFLWFEFKRFF